MKVDFLVTLFNVILSTILNIITNMYFQFKHTISLCLTVAVFTFVTCHCDKKSHIVDQNITELLPVFIHSLKICSTNRLFCSQ